ncbi:MAG: carboxypeptidase regulatory-like domain-containing protein [Chitinophagales bacterium]|nr:carboxypeptidase regulatory-like domain-containing protein [Chitinophagales bacterium]
MNSKYNCAQPELYSGARMVIRAAVRELPDFTAIKPKYDSMFFTNLEAEVAAAEVLPDEQYRNSIVEAMRNNTIAQAKLCLNIWQQLKSYIEDTPQFKGVQLKPALEAAGSTVYLEASGMDWESVNVLMVNGKQFITDYNTVLTAGGNMLPTFVADWDAAHLAFTTTWQQFKDREDTNVIAAENKLNANNTLYEKIIQICKDGQRIFRHTEAHRQQFVWDSVLYAVRGAGIAGLRGTITNAATGLPIAGAQVLVIETGDTGITGEDGKYSITGVPAGNYNVKASATGYNPVEEPFEVLTGTISALNFALPPS